MAGRRGQNEGSIYQRKDGRWAGAITLGDGRRKTFYGKTRSEAARKVSRALADLQRGVPPADDRITVGTHMRTWLEARKDSLRYNTYRDYESRIRLHLEPQLGSIRLSKLTPEHVEKMLMNTQEKGLSPRTCQYVHAVLRAGLENAVKRGHVHRNVAKLVDGPAVRREPVKTLTVEEAKTFLAAAAKERLLGSLFEVTLGLGLRKGEGLGLRWQDIDLDKQRLWVRHGLQRQKGKGLVLVEPKSRSSRRPLALPDFVVQALRRQRRVQAEQRLAAGSDWRDQDYVFTMPNGRPISPDYINALFPRFMQRTFSRCNLCGEGRVREGRCEKCGEEVEVKIPEISFHGLRHSCASLLFAQGCSLRLVMEILGHSQIALTANTYTHLLPEADREAATAMETLLGAGS